MKKSIAVLLAIISLASLSACGTFVFQENAGTAHASAIAVTDMAGREITLEKPAARIVAIMPADVEILYAIGAGDLLVGRGIYCDYPEAALNVLSVESGDSLNVEQVMALLPDVVLISQMNHGNEQVRALESTGVKVIVNNASDIAGVYASIGIIGAVTGREAQAKELVDSMKQSFAEMESKSYEAHGKTVYFEVSPLEHGLWTAGKNTFMDELAAMLGLRNAFDDVDGWAEISEEQIIQRDPDYIVTITMYFGDGPEPADEILARSGWENITAVKNGAVFVIGNDEVARPGPRLVNAAEALYEYTRVT
ncbi:MAG: ABC transporter substrate-binding protein [Oscillospiraceae bacterium]|nr:ABC transporter substrate-binding protein [Oscillospiraceae bacterium]